MKLSIICDELPRTATATLPVPCDEALHPAALRVEVRCEPVSPGREDELLRLACVQRIEHLRARLGAVGEACRSALCANRTLLC